MFEITIYAYVGNYKLLMIQFRDLFVYVVHMPSA